MKKEEILAYTKKTNMLLYIVIALLIVNIIMTIVTGGEIKPETIYNENFDTSVFTNISLKDLESYVDTEEYKLLVIGKPNCEYTINMLPILKQAQQKYNYETLYVDLRTVTEEDREVLFKYDDETNFIQEYMGTTPFIIVFKNNQMVDTWVGYQEYSVFQSFLEKLGIEMKEN